MGATEGIVPIALHHFSAEAKYGLLLALLDDHLKQYEPQSVIRFATMDGRVLGHFTPTSVAKAEWERKLAELPEGVRRMASEPLPANLQEHLSESELTAIRRKVAASSALPQS